MILDNISPSELELCILQLPPDEEPEGDKDFHLEKEDDLPDIDATAHLDEYNDDFVRKEHFVAQLNLIKQAQLDLKKDIQAVNKDIIGLKDLLVATADRIFIELDAIAKKVAASTDSKDCDMEANFSFGFGSNHEVCAEEVTKNNEDHVQMTHTTKESTPIEVDIKVGTNGDDENFTPLSTQDYEIIDETVRSASKGSAKRNSVVNESTPIEVGIKVGTNGDDENFTPLSTQDYETIDETVRSASKGSAKRNFVVNAPAHDRRGDIPSFKSFPSQGMIVFSSGSGSSEGNNRGLVDEHPRKPAYDKTPGKETSAIFGAAEYPNFRLFSTQEEQEIFKKDGIGNNVTDLNEYVAGQSKQAEFFKGNDDATLPHNLICAPNYVTPPNHQLVYFRRQPKFNLSSFPNTYGDGCCFPIVSKKVFFSRKHPFTTNIWRRLDSSLANIFRTWIKIQLRKKSMVEALGLGKFYGSSLPRPRFYKTNEERMDPPLPVLDPLLSWADEAHWSMGGRSFTRHRLQGRIEGNIEKLRAQLESPSPPPAPLALKRKRRLVDESKDENEGLMVKGLKRKLEDEFDEVAEESGGKVKAIARRTRSRRNEEVVVEVVSDVKCKGEKVKKSGKRSSPRLSKCVLP